jgi:hypothetical protein
VSFGQVFEPSTLTMVDLVPDIEDRLPTEVVEALGDVTDIDDAIALLGEVGLLEEATAAVTADPELFDAYNQVVAGGTYRSEASVSADGETWTVLGDFTFPRGSEYVNLAQSDGEHLVVVEQVWSEDGTAGTIVVSTTDNLVDWTSVTVPVSPAGVPDYVRSDAYPNTLALGTDGWYLTVYTSAWLDLSRLVPAEIQSDFPDGYRVWADVDGLHVDTYEEWVYEASASVVPAPTVDPGDEPPVVSDESRLLPWSELGITFADYERYTTEEAGGAAAFIGAWDGAVATAAPPAGGDCCSVLGTDSGFIAQSWGGWEEPGDSGGQTLRFSTDGKEWAEIDGPPGGESLNSLAAVAGGVIGVDGAGTIWRASASGRGWVTVDIPGLPDSSNLWFAQQGGRGVASVIDVAVYDYDYESLQVPYVMTIEQDGFEIRSETAADGSATLVVTERSTGTVVIDETFDPLLSVIPDFLSSATEVGNSVALLDSDGEVVVTVSMETLGEATSRALAEAQAEIGWVEPEYDYTPDFWLVATADGIEWYVEDLFDGAPDTGFGPAAVNGDTVVIRRWEGGWERFSIS